MYAGCLWRHAPRRAFCGGSVVRRTSKTTPHRRRHSTLHGKAVASASTAFDAALASPFIQQSHEYQPDYERAIHLSARVLGLGTSEMELERSHVSKEVSSSAACKDGHTSVERSIEGFRERMLSQVFTDNATVNEITRYVLSLQSKLFRPRLGLLMARVLSGRAASSDTSSSCMPAVQDSGSYANEDVMKRVMRLLQSYEIVHAGSLVHDDILDDADTRRRAQTVHLKVGTKASILVGDLMLSRACSVVANLGSQQSTIRMAKVLENLIKGELTRVKVTDSVEGMMRVYLQKIFLKTASLIAECCASIADLFRLDAILSHKCYLIGLHVGMAFQIYDDLLDYRSASADLGKPTLSDVSSGLVTMPLLMALTESSELRALFADGAIPTGNVDTILSLVRGTQAFERCQCAVMLHLSEVSRLLRGLECEEAVPSSPLSGPAHMLLRFVFDTLTRSQG
ncbi:polyprenyl synthetase superfamily protein [Babesia caballi]|uniref:Polyprenyl synthetase superfamily protein n=1 Tax=Babesia caballi TaxID=5871 RepID=A0AAV4LZA6_BABCB|nr:polyprenyl synthetase superfamily protein [Babesia caballi]